MCNCFVFEEYKAMGGTASQLDFSHLEIMAQKKLDYWTQGRAAQADCDDIRLCMTLIINALSTVQNGGDRTVNSFSNDGVSVNLAARPEKTEEEIIASVYDQIVEILPTEIVSVVVG